MEETAHILIVDDEMGIREGCRRVLSEAGYSVEDAEDGAAGLEKMRKADFDLAVVDLMMPGIGGLDLIETAYKRDPETILIVITGYATIETAVEATKRGAYDYLPKPFTPEALLAVVRRGLEKRALSLKAKHLHEERERRLLELAGEKSRMRTVIGCIGDGVLVVNREKQLVLWNNAAVKQMRFKTPFSSGQRLDEIVESEPLIALFKEILESPDRDLSMISREFEGENHSTVIMASAAPVRDEVGESLGAVAILRDISELKEIEKIKSQFVSMVAHELKSPLAAIEGWLELVLSGEAGDTPESESAWLERARTRAHGLLAMVNDLLVMSRMDAGKVALKVETFSLKPLLEQIIELFEHQAAEKKIRITMDYNDDLPPVQADKKDMEKVFTNLVNNACKYNKEGGTIHINVSADPVYLRVEIADEGIGMSRDEATLIFDEFYRIENTKTKRIPGTGLGLAIAKRIIDSHHGKIEVESREGEGSTFVVSLPLKRS